MLLLLLSLFSRVRLCATPEMAAHEAPLSLGFSRQEHWSGLSFPSPVPEREKWKWSCSVVSDSWTPWTAAYQAPLSMGFSRQEYWSGVPLPSPWFLHKLSWFNLRVCSCNHLHIHKYPWYGPYFRTWIFSYNLFYLKYVSHTTLYKF